MPATPTVLTVTAAHERGYLALRHGLHPAVPVATIEQLATAHSGLHAARLPTPYVTLAARLPGFTAKELRQALEPGGGLIKLRTCRRTLHIYPLTEAAAAHTATLALRLGATAASTRRLGKDPAVLLRLAPAIRDALAAGPLPHRELEQRVLAAPLRIRARRDQLAVLVRLAIKWLWESGELAYGNTADSLHRERREFHLTHLAHPRLRLDGVDVDQAVLLLLRRYLAAFGPASIGDFQWWSGLNRTAITPVLAALRPELVDVQLDQRPDRLLLLAQQEAALRGAEPLPADHLTLLAYEDPALKGYFTTRHRYVDHQHRGVLFNTIGEARASIALAGQTAGTWTFNRATRSIDQNLFAPIPANARRALAERINRMTDFLRSEPC